MFSITSLLNLKPDLFAIRRADMERNAQQPADPVDPVAFAAEEPAPEEEEKPAPEKKRRPRFVDFFIKRKDGDK